MEQTRYALKRIVDMPYQQALDRTREALKEQGFGVLTEIDMKDKLREKLGVDIRRYIILGACNPPLAHEALQAETDIGLLLPCNVVVYEETAERSVVAALDPGSMVEMTGNSALAGVASQAQEKLRTAIANV